ncbi:MAG: type II toxin-antitoxin system RelE/ParE family toxin [Nanoarchaeota archaeon]
MHEVIISPNAERDLKKLNPFIQERILKVLERVKIRPEAHFERMVGEKTYKLRIGDYRLIADMDKNRLVILVIKIGHRKNIYKK